MEMNSSLLLLFLLSILPISTNSSTPSTLNDDILGLIVFKADLFDPLAKLSSWNEDDVTPCNWTGVKCDSKTNRVAELSLSGFSLSGKIGRGLLQLQFLRSLTLSKNNFTGKLNPDIIRLESLQNLDLSGNSLSGSIPDEFFSQCRSIRSVSLAKNAFDGVIPSSIGSCDSLSSLNLSANRLSGPLPSGIWSLNTLRWLDLSDNSLVGEIPDGISKMYNLRWVSFRGNRFSGNFPDNIGDCLLLKSVDFGENSLSGNLPDSMRKLFMCTFLGLGQNSLSGELPAWIGDLRSLRTLDLSDNGFSGQLPGSLWELQSLKELKVSGNAFTGSLPDSVPNMKSLSNVDFSENKFTGSLPSWIFSSGLVEISFSGNELTGLKDIPKISTPTLQRLDLSSNALSGAIPMEISSISSLQYMNLSSNLFSGSIPKSISELKSMKVLDLSRNQLNGSIPEEISGVVSLRELNLEKNHLTGGIPTQIGKCSFLTTLDLSHNNLRGQIPAAIANLINIRTIDFSRNNLTGTIPKALSNLPHLFSFNISRNNLSGPLPSSNFFNTIAPSSLTDNPNLCGAAVNRSCPSDAFKPIVLNPNSSSSSTPYSRSSYPTASHKKIILSISALVAIAAAVAITIGVITITVLNLRVRASAAASASRSAAALELSDGYLSQSPTTDANSGKLVMFSGVDTGFSASAHALLNKDCELGRGGFGAVYKTNLRDGRPVAIKKLTVSSLVKSQEDFERVVRKLGKVSHPNLVALQGYYWTPSLQLLIYEFVPGGSLHKHLHDSSSPLSWQERFDIILGTARSLAHLHRLDIIHYNLKSSNVLVDGYGEAKVGDHGLARLLPMLDRYVLSSKMQSALGYMAPEFGCGTVRLTEKCDVYAFGVLVLEVVSGRRPVQYMEDDVVVLCDVARGALEEGRVEELVDGRLRGRFPSEEAVPVFKLGLICTSQVPSNRPDMEEVVNILELIRCPRDSTDEELI